MTPKDSAKIIRSRIEGIELAKKTDCQIELSILLGHIMEQAQFIIFTKRRRRQFRRSNDRRFSISWPNPFSRETAILMMSDAAEAASKSLKEPTAQSIDALIDKITAKTNGRRTI